MDLNLYLDKPRTEAPSMPRSRLFSLTRLVERLAELSRGRASVPELVDALTRVYDARDMMLFECHREGLAEAIDPSPYLAHAGHEARLESICELWTSRFWSRPEATIRDVPVSLLMVLREDAVVIAARLWELFVPEEKKTPDYYQSLFDEPGPERAGSAAGDPAGNDGTLGWSWGAYETKLLRDLAAAAQH